MKIGKLSTSSGICSKIQLFFMTGQQKTIPMDENFLWYIAHWPGNICLYG